MHECVPGSRLWSRGLDGTKSNSSHRLISILAYFCLRAPRDNLTMERNEARSALRYLGGIAIVDNCMSLLAPVPPWVLQGMTENMRRLIKRLRLTALLMLLIATASGCNLERITPTPLPTPDRPRVEILRPAAEQQVVEGATFDIDILAVDYSQGIQRVELYVDGFLLNASEPPESTVGVFGNYELVRQWLGLAFLHCARLSRRWRQQRRARNQVAGHRSKLALTDSSPCRD